MEKDEKPGYKKSSKVSSTLKGKVKSKFSAIKTSIQPKKRNWGKRIQTWFQLVWKTYVTEVEDRVLSSPKRLIKFAGISIIPIIYGVICIVAFWNPIANIGRAPMVIMDQDQAVVMVESTKENPTTTQNATNPYYFGPLKSITGVTTSDVNTKMGYNNLDETKSIHQSSNGSWLIPNNLIDTDTKIAKLEATILGELNSQTSATVGLTTRSGGDDASFTYDATNPTFNLKVMSGWTMAKSVLQPSSADESDLNHTFKSNKINNTYQLTNITYLNDQKEIDHQWEGTKYYVQMKIPDGFIEKLLTYLGTMLVKSDPVQNSDGTTTDVDGDFLAQLVASMDPLDVWTTFERNFIFGYYLTTISSVIGGVFLKAIPTILNNVLISDTGASISYKGATIKKLIGSGDGEDVLWDIEGSSTKATLKDATSYIIPNAANLPENSATNANNKDYTVFGNIDAGLDDSGEVNPSATADQVGGKFINLLQTVLNTASNAPLLTKIITIAKALGIGGNAESLINLLNNVIAVIKGVLGNAPINTGLITLNYETYQVATGKTSLAGTKYLSQIVATLWKQLTGTDIDYNNFHASPVMTEKAIMTNDQFIANLNTNIKNNSAFLLGATNLNELLPKILAQLLAKNSYGMTDQKLANMTIQGSKFGLYGIGLGEFFLLIGLYVGSLLQSFIFDRAKRTKKATATSWYLGKWLLFTTIALIQGTLVTWVTYAVGWHQLGVETMLYVWLWLMFSIIIFMTIIQGIWFTIEDEAVGRFCCVIVLVLSLAAGGGTFPAISQFAFFHAISYVVPFTYVLRGLGAIVYGVSTSGTTALTTNYILTQLGILLIYFVLFIALGLGVGSRLLMRQMNWGSQRGRVVVQALKNLGRDDEVAAFATKRRSASQWMGKYQHVRYKYHWKTLKPDFDQELYFACRKIRLADGFNWWKRKKHDFVQKPNYSDEESITRNE